MRDEPNLATKEQWRHAPILGVIFSGGAIKPRSLEWRILGRIRWQTVVFPPRHSVDLETIPEERLGFPITCPHAHKMRTSFHLLTPEPKGVGNHRYRTQ